MKTGPKPYQALREALGIASRMGRACVNGRQRGLHYDLTIALATCTLFVMFRRSRYMIADVEDIMDDYRRDLARLRRVPATAVSVRMFWVRRPDGTWRYFLVLDDAVAEVPAGTIPQPGGPGAGLPGSDVPPPDLARALPDVIPQGGRFFCPFLGVPPVTIPVREV